MSVLIYETTLVILLLLCLTRVFGFPVEMLFVWLSGPSIGNWECWTHVLACHTPSTILGVSIV